ncbi:MAG: hypothetical protein GKC07_08045 [Methanomicrobiales archaeon]|nr:hypothetical protein [Methanomicrobiales archaeon]
MNPASEMPCPFGEGDGAGGPAEVFPEVNPASEMPCPFGEGDGAGGPAEVFPDVNPASEMPCPFGESEGGGPAGMIPPDIPVPFPLLGSEADGDSGTGFYPPPGDPDGDGFYEDLNGNGYIDNGDLLLYTDNLAWIRDNQPLCRFDYDSNGAIGYADAILLMDEI